MMVTTTTSPPLYQSSSFIASILTHRNQRHHHRADYDHLMPLSPNVDDSGLGFALRQTPHPVEVVFSIQTLEQLRKLGCMSPNPIFFNFGTTLHYLGL